MYEVIGCKIDGIVGCVPSNNIDNLQALTQIYGVEAENIVRATGIENRRVSSGESTLELFHFAAKKVIKETNTQSDEIGAVICVTFTPKYRMPFNSTLLQDMLGLKNDIIAFDLNLACSGYAYGLYTAGLIANSTGKKVLLLDGDVQSVFTSPFDKGTLPVLADGGSATIVTPKATKDTWQFSFYTDGSKGENLIMKAGGSNKVLSEDDLKYRQLEDGSKIRDVDIFMNGFEIFKFVAKDVVNLIKKELGDRISDIDIFVPHQANMYMIKQLCRAVKIDVNKMWKSGHVYGNSSSATVPITIAHNGNSIEMPRQKTLIAGFGGGLSVGVGIIDLYKDAYYQVVDYIGDNK